MYALQKPDYNFPRDYIYFSQVEIDDSCIYVNRNSPFKTIEDVVAAAKKRMLNVAVSRLPTQTSIAALALGEATGARFNLIPYGGGNPTYIAVLNGEVDIGASPMVGVMTLIEKFKVLGVFNRKQNVYADLTDNAPTVNSVFGIDIPDLFTSRAWGFTPNGPTRTRSCSRCWSGPSREAHASEIFREGYRKTGADRPQPGLRRPQGLHRIRAQDLRAGAALREAAHRQARQQGRLSPVAAAALPRFQAQPPVARWPMTPVPPAPISSEYAPRRSTNDDQILPCRAGPFAAALPPRPACWPPRRSAARPRRPIPAAGSAS